MTLADILLAEGLVAQAPLDAARQAVARSGEPLVVALIELEGVSETPLAEALARRLDVPIADLTIEPVEGDALRELTVELARANRVMPLTLEKHQGKKVLRLAMADPTDRDTISRVEKATGLSIAPVLSVLGAIDDAITRGYRGLSEPAARVPFGGSLGEVSTPVGTASPSTEPWHRVEDEAPVELRLRALLAVLEAKGLVTVDEYITELRQMLRGRD